MELEECKSILCRLLGGKYSSRDVLLCKNLSCIKKVLGFDYEDVCLIIKNRPDILFLEAEDFSSNAKEYAQNFNVFSREFKNLVLKFPAILTMRCCIFQYKIKQIANIFDVSTIDAIKLMYFYPALLTLKKDYVKKQLEMLSCFFQEDSFLLRKVLRVEPRLIFANERSICDIKDIFKNLGFTDAETCLFLKEAPSILFLRSGELLQNIQKLYPVHFNRREFKDIMIRCPYILLNVDKFLASQVVIKNVLGENPTNIILKAPPIFYDFEGALSEANGLSISKNYISSFPEIFNEPLISLKLKLIISGVTGLERDFEKLLSLPVSLLASRFLFMQFYGIFEYKNLLLDEESFEKIYSIGSQELLKGFAFDAKTLSRTIEFYISKKGSNLVDIDLFQMLLYLGSKPSVDRGIKQSKLRCGIFDRLVMMNFSRAEALYIISVCPSIVDYDEENIIKVYEEFLRLGLTSEEFLKLAIYRPSIFCASFSDIQNIFSSKFEVRKSVINHIMFDL